MSNYKSYLRHHRLECLENRNLMAANGFAISQHPTVSSPPQAAVAPMVVKAAPTTISLKTGNIELKEGDSGYQELEITLQPTMVPSSIAEVRVFTTSTPGGTVGVGVGVSASPGSDYQSVDQKLTWFPGQTHAQVVRVRVYGDTRYEGSESFWIKAVPSNLNTRLSSNSSLSVLIQNDDQSPPPLPAFANFLSVSTESVIERGAGKASLARVHLKLASPQNVPLSVIGWTSDGSAKAGTDFVKFGAPIIFEAGETEKIIEISILGDNLVEADEKFTVLFGSQGYRGNVEAIVTITDDDKSMPNPVATLFRDGRWFLDKGDGGVAEIEVDFGFKGDTPLTGDYNGDGHIDLVAIRPNSVNGMLEWHFDYGADGIEDRYFQFGFNADLPIAGDFDGNGRSDATVVRQNRASGMLDWYIDTANDGVYAEKVLNYGLIGDTPIAGDFDGNGRTDATIVRRNGNYLNWWMDLAGDGIMAERVATFGLVGDAPIVGDWNGDGKDDLGVARFQPDPAIVDLLLDLDGQGGNQEKAIRYGSRGDKFVSRT